MSVGSGSLRCFGVAVADHRFWSRLADWMGPRRGRPWRVGELIDDVGEPVGSIADLTR
jgi:hypothetical protein